MGSAAADRSNEKGAGGAHELFRGVPVRPVAIGPLDLSVLAWAPLLLLYLGS